MTDEMRPNEPTGRNVCTGGGATQHVIDFGSLGRPILYICSTVIIWKLIDAFASM